MVIKLKKVFNNILGVIAIGSVFIPLSYFVYSELKKDLNKTKWSVYN